MLEPSTAARWADDWLGVEMRADGLMWVMTCNEIGSLSETFRDDCIVVGKPVLGGSGREAAVSAATTDLARESHLRMHDLPSGAAAALDGVSVRRVRMVLRVALGIAVTSGREVVDVDDVRAALTVVGAGPSEGRVIGFVR